jgi:hypothetical protein
VAGIARGVVGRILAILLGPARRRAMLFARVAGTASVRLIYVCIRVRRAVQFERDLHCLAVVGFIVAAGFEVAVLA